MQFNLPSQGLRFGIRKHSGIKHRNGSSFRHPFPRGTLHWWKLVHLKQIHQIRITSNSKNIGSETSTFFRFQNITFQINSCLLYCRITQTWANNGAPLSPFATTGSRSSIVYLKACREATRQNSPTKTLMVPHGSNLKHTKKTGV